MGGVNKTNSSEVLKMMDVGNVIPMGSPMKKKQKSYTFVNCRFNGSKKMRYGIFIKREKR